MPEIIPPPASLLRQVAYSRAVRIPGPAADPLGWHEVSPAVMFGKLPSGKAVKLQCLVCTYEYKLHGMMLTIPLSFQLSLANPVS